MNNLIILCGAPASGKTTLSKRLMNENEFDFYSFDDLKCVMHSNLIPYIRSSLVKGKNVLVDSTYFRKKMREELLESIVDFNCKKTVIFLDVSLEECVIRNKQRDKSIQNCLVTGIYNFMQPPSYDEGWDEIIYL